MAARISHTTVINCHNAEKASDWWKDVFYYTDVPGKPNDLGSGQFLIEDPRTGHRLLFITTPDRQRSVDRPTLELVPTDSPRGEEIERAVRLGAQVVGDHRKEDGSGYLVLKDPVGNHFRVYRSDAERSAPHRVLGGEQLPWGVGFVVVSLVVIVWLLLPLSFFEKSVVFVPPFIVCVALGIARFIEWKTSSDLEASLIVIERDYHPLDVNEPWSKELHRLRSEYLLDVRAHAERWRTIFASLLAVFGAIVLVGRPQTPNFTEGVMKTLTLLTVVGLASSLTAIALAGWAAAAAPKIDWLRQTDPSKLRRRMFEHANRSAARLRAALTCGAVALVAVLAGIAVALLGAQV